MILDKDGKAFGTGRKCGNCNGCAETRQPNKDFQCIWLTGLFANEDRPDKCGVLVTNGTGTMGDIPLLLELWQDASRTGRGNKVLMGVFNAAKRLLVDEANGKRRFVGTQADYIEAMTKAGAIAREKMRKAEQARGGAQAGVEKATPEQGEKKEEVPPAV